MLAELIHLLLVFGVSIGSVAGIIWGLALYGNGRERRRQKDLAEAEVSEEELTVKECRSRWDCNMPTPPPVYVPSSSGLSTSGVFGGSAQNQHVEYQMHQEAWRSFNSAMEHHIRHPETHRGWYDNDFTTDEYPGLLLHYCSDKALERSSKVLVKLWKHARTGRILTAKVMRRAA
jgi:hypothetical protein